MHAAEPFRLSAGHDLDCHTFTHKEPTVNFFITDMLTPQALTVLHHMAKTGSITQREALADHSIQSLTRRISEINDAGIVVNTERKRHPITKQRYARYSLQRPELVALPGSV